MEKRRVPLLGVAAEKEDRLRTGENKMTIQAPTPTQGYAVSMLPSHKAEDLTKGGNLAHIELGDQLYTLRITRAGKLILTK